MSVPDMKLGNVSAAMGVGVYFFILRLREGKLEPSWVRKLLGIHMSGYSYVKTQATVFPSGRVVSRNASAGALGVTSARP